ncbi:MAG: TolC family protein [Candidatus Omnitrophica bacterium]|nr:TolC family protein [Candidatus Omnitrophota bacterium]
MCRCFKLFLILFLFCLVSSGRAEAEEVLTWGDCIKEAAKNHPDLIAAQESVKQSRASKQQTASGLFPQITADASGATAKTAGSLGSKTADTYSYGVTGTQLIFDGLKTINNVRAASETISAAKQGFKFTSTTVRFRLRSAFIDLLKAQEMLRITEEIYNIRRDNLELITLRYGSGLEHKGALLTAEADLAQAKYGISQTKREVEVAQREMVKEMGRKQPTAMYAQGDFRVKDSALEKPDFPALAKNNPSLQQLIAQKRSAEFSLKSAYANFFPQLTGSAGANRTGAHWTPTGDQYNLGLALSLPLFEGGLRIAQVSQASALVKQLQENERSTLDGVILTLQQTWATLQDTLENVNVQYKVLIAAQERSKIAQAQYSIGLVSFDNWTIIEDNLVKAKSNYLDAQAAALLAEAKWIQAKGETLEYD